MNRIRALAALLVSGSIAGAFAGCSSDSSSGGDTGDNPCQLHAQLSGGIDVTLEGTSQACLYSARSVAFAPLDAKVVVSLIIRKIEPGQTGTFDATLGVSRGGDRWEGASCTLDVTSNVPAPPPRDAGLSFNPHALKGKGSCSTQAVYRGDAGAKAPVTIAPFTFAFTTLFY
ncbi:hypothetical protein [Pendulispora albinea]|uniref:Lipoprotein n=1 Tax=Pendulispora albinea TaxID=2741071 RepID=A0ABZ2LZE6_9BACT